MRAPVIAGLSSSGTISPLDPASGGEAWNAGMGQASTQLTAWPSANRAIFFPFILNDWLTFTQMGWENGVTASGNVDVGVYDKSLAKIVTAGSTAQSGTSAFQAVTVTSTTLAPDFYWLAMAMDNTTGTVRSNTGFSATAQRLMGVQQMAAAFVLPSTITLATPASTYVPLVVIGFESVL